MSDEQEMKPLDYVYAGRRVLTGGRIGHSIYTIGEDGELASEERLYDLGAKHSAIIGGIYRGATFSETKSIGVAVAKFHSRYEDRERITDWQAEDRATEIEMASRRMKANEKRNNEIDAIMLPLRKRIDAARKRGDFAGVMALRQAIMGSMEKPVRKDEDR